MYNLIILLAFIWIHHSTHIHTSMLLKLKINISGHIQNITIIIFKLQATWMA